MESLSAWLDDLGLGQYIGLFDAGGIDAAVLPHLTEHDLSELGLPIGPRRKILVAIRAMGGFADARAEPASSDEPMQAERRQLTVMFCDLVGSTALANSLDPEALRELMQAYQQSCGSIIEKYEGHVAQYLGDGLVAYFGWPRAHEDDAERAVHAARGILIAIKGVSAPEPLAARVGIATGAVVVGETGTGDASVPKAAVGPTPNLAARLQAMAGADQIVVAPSTLRLLGNTFEFEDLGEQQIKGVAQPVRVARVIGLGSQPRRGGSGACRAGFAGPA
jgi:class 3 adenylate cyclase